MLAFKPQIGARNVGHHVVCGTESLFVHCPNFIQHIERKYSNFDINGVCS